MDPAWASAFYGMAVGPEVCATVTEHLTDRSIADLVDAHLAINRSYFGAIDKTLAGFVIQDDHGDDYTLYDLRDTQQIWFQDHETRDEHHEHGVGEGGGPADRAARCGDPVDRLPGP